MAEVLAAVSSIITIIETARKLSTSALKLKRAWDEVQDVPYMIRQVMQQLEILAPTLDCMADEFQQTRTIVQNDGGIQPSLQYCKLAFEELEALTIDISDQIVSARKGKRTMTKFKVTLKRNVIQGYEKRLQNALQMILISQQTYSCILSRVRHSIIVAELQALQNKTRREYDKETDVKRIIGCEPLETAQSVEIQSIGQLCRDKMLDAKLSTSTRQPYRYPPNFSYQTAHASEICSYSIASKVYKIRFQLPTWMMRKAWDFQVHRAYDGWKIRLTPWYTRPWDDEIFDHVRKGRTAELLAMFQANAASLYDCTPDGFTLLDQALFTPQVSLFKLLLNMGLDIQDCSKQWDLYWEYLSYQDKCGTNHADILSFTRFLFDKGRFDDEIEPLFTNCGREGGGCSLERIVFNIPGVWKILQEMGLPKFEPLVSIPNLRIRRWDLSEPRLILDILTGDGSVSPTSFRAQLPDVDPAYSFATAYMIKVHRAVLKKTNDMRLLARWIISGASPEEVLRMAGGSCTPLQLTLFHMGNYWDNPNYHIQHNLKAMLRAWVEDLDQGGVNIEAYGSLEAAALKKGVGDSFFYLGKTRECKYIHHAALEYGPHLDDWKLNFDPCVETYAGEFWATLSTEKKLLPGPVPGAWLDEDDD